MGNAATIRYPHMPFSIILVYRRTDPYLLIEYPYSVAVLWALLFCGFDPFGLGDDAHPTNPHFGLRLFNISSVSAQTRASMRFGLASPGTQSVISSSSFE